jgi:hypothetical protein
MAKPVFSINVDSIIKNRKMLDDYKHPLVCVYEITADGHGENTAHVIRILSADGWIPILQSSAYGAGMSKKISIRTTFRRLK